MNPEELYQVQVALIANIEGIFQTWIGFTFAAIVAFHFASEKLNTFLLCLIITIYVLASFVFASRYVHVGATIMHYNEMLVAGGHAPHPVLPPEISFAMLILFVVGTLGTVGYGIYAYRKGNSS